MTENPVALHGWMIAGPEIARLVEECDEHSDKQYGKLQEQSEGVEAELRKDVTELIGILYGVGNPFCDDGKNIVTLDTWTWIDQ